MRIPLRYRLVNHIRLLKKKRIWGNNYQCSHTETSRVEIVPIAKLFLVAISLVHCLGNRVVFVVHVLAVQQREAACKLGVLSSDEILADFHRQRQQQSLNKVRHTQSTIETEH